MKKTNLLAILAAGIFFVLGATMYAQNNASATASAEAKIVSGISLEKIDDMQFGQIVRSSAAGTVMLDPSTGDRSAFGGVTLGQNGGYQVAKFSAAGEGEYTYAVTLPQSITIAKANSNATMTVDQFTSSLGLANTGALDINGEDEFTIGATLNVDANQETGLYSGEFTVTAAYN